MSSLNRTLSIYFGGSFNPFHKGHAAIVSTLLQNFPHSKIVLLPNSLSPFKLATKVDKQSGGNEVEAQNVDLVWPTVEQKKAMMQIALRELKLDLGSDSLQLEDYELRKQGLWHKSDCEPCYTADTLQAIAAPRGCCFALGWDSFVELYRWKNWQYLVDHCHFLVFQRGAAEQKLPEHPAFGLISFDLFELDFRISSSELRSLYASSEGAAERSLYLSPAMAAYIEKTGLYRRKLAH